MNIYQFYPNDPRYYFLVLEYMEGGELFDRIAQKVSLSGSKQEQGVRAGCNKNDGDS